MIKELTSTELTLIGAYKDQKYDSKKTETLYPNNYFSQADIYLNTIKFLRYVRTQIANDDTKKDLKDKIDEILKELSFDEEKLAGLITKYNSHIEYGKRVIMRKIQQIVIDNRKDVEYLVGIIYPVGRDKKIIDPSDSTGKY